MTFASGPAQETLRLAKLNDYNILDTLPEPVYDDIVELVAHICQTPASLVSLIDANRQWFKAKIGFEATESPRNIAFCSYTIEHSGVMVVEDTHQSERFRNNPLVTGEPYIRFYAGAPLVTPEGYALGSLCVIDYQPRHLDERQLRALEVLSHQVVAQLELRRQSYQLKSANETLEKRVKERTTTLASALHRLLQAQSKLLRREAKSGHHALHDPLTGLANRSYFMQRLDQAVQLSCRQPSHLYALLCINLNNFKPMNNALGHDVGDRILCHVADHITRLLRKSDLVARLGGDEFAVLLDDIPDKGHATTVVKRLQAQLKTPFFTKPLSSKPFPNKPFPNKPFSTNEGARSHSAQPFPTQTHQTEQTQSEHEISISASIGITFSSLGYRHPKAVLKDAETAMYHAKKQAKQTAQKRLNSQLHGQHDQQQSGKAGDTVPQNLASPILIQEETLSEQHFAIFDTTMAGHTQARLTLEDELRQALHTDQFQLYYQPIFAISEVAPTDTPPSVQSPSVQSPSAQSPSIKAPSVLVGLEGLLRWHHPTRGCLKAEDFIAIAEEIGIVRQLTAKIIESACRNLQVWQGLYSAASHRHKRDRHTPALSLHINLSRRQLSYPGLIPLWETHLSQYQLTPDNFQLEISEEILISQNPSITAVLQQLKAMGFKLCIDDFGRGHSSLSRLHQLDIDTFKIDRTFIQELSTPNSTGPNSTGTDSTDTDSISTDIVKTIVTLGQSTRVDVIAEGIETAPQLKAVMDLGCQLVQGVWLSEALSETAVEPVLMRQS